MVLVNSAKPLTSRRAREEEPTGIGVVTGEGSDSRKEIAGNGKNGSGGGRSEGPNLLVPLRLPSLPSFLEFKNQSNDFGIPIKLASGPDAVGAEVRRKRPRIPILSFRTFEAPRG